MKKILSLIYLSFFSLALLSLFPKCANIKPPTGGPRDTIPPALLYSVPPNKSINYKGRTFYFEFNERIKLDKFKNQLIITPRIESNYTTKLKKNSFTMIFDDDFKDSTTYTFNFREGIKDLTEGNVTKDNKFVFSTGNFIDSLSITGTITNLITGDTLEGILVGIYNILDDTVTIFNGSPYYFTETDEKGFYSLENIINGVYKIYAFKDDNSNLKLESKSEAYGFIPDTLFLNENMENIDIRIYNLDIRDLELQTAMPSGKYFYINFNKYITDYTLYPIKEKIQLFSGYAKEHHSVKIYNTFENTDSIEIAFHVNDSINNIVSDTVWVKFKESNRKPDKFELKLSPKAGPLPLNFNLTFTFSKPVIYVNKDSIFFQFDTTRINDFPDDSLFNWNERKDELIIPVKLNKTLADTIAAIRSRKEKMKMDSLKSKITKKKKGGPLAKKQMASKESKKPHINRGLQLYLGEGSFISVEKDTLKTTTSNYVFASDDQFGIISGKVSTNYPGYFIQLIDLKNNVVQELHNVKNYRFKRIPPGEYKIRILIDNNDNGVWDPGNMKKNEEPEEVLFFPKTISIRANWELNQNLIF